MTTDPKQLLADAELVDLATSKPDEFTAIISRTRQTTLQLLLTCSQPQWVAAVRQHGSERDALAAARAELADVTCRLEVAQQAQEALREGKMRLRADARLHDAKAVLVQKSLDHSAQCRTLESAIQQAERSRDAKVRALIDDGVPEATALSVARPNLGEIERLKEEHEAIPAQQAEIRRLVGISANLVRHVYAELGETA